MFSHNKDSLTVTKSRIRRFKSHNQVIKNIQFFIASPSKLSKHGALSKSRSKPKIIENKLFASAKKVDDKATLFTNSTMSDEEKKISNFLSSGLTKSVSKRSLYTTKTNKIKIRNATSQEFTPSATQVSDHQISILIKQYTTIDGKKMSFPFQEDQSSIIFEQNLGLNSQIIELDQSIENDITLLKMIK